MFFKSLNSSHEKSLKKQMIFIGFTKSNNDLQR